MAYGVTPAGFVNKPIDQCLAELQALARGTFGQGIKLNPSSKWGQFLGILAERESSIWDLAQDVYTSRDPEQAQGAALEALCSLTGTGRAAATRSTWTTNPPVLSGLPGTVVPAGKVASVAGTGARFVLQADVTIGGGGTATGIFAAENAGAVPAPSGTLTVIETPVAGWTGITNPIDATLGSNADSDQALRQKRIAALAAAGSATVEAIASDVLNVPGVTAVFVFENSSGMPNDAGLPGNSVQVLVQGGDDAAVAAAIWHSKSAGIQTYGSTSITITDAAGNPQVVKFSRPTDLPIYLALTITVDAKKFPGTGEAQIKAALVTYAQSSLFAGSTLYPRALIPSIFGVVGVLNVSACYAGTAPAPASEAPIVVSPLQRPVLDSSRIAIAYV